MKLGNGKGENFLRSLDRSLQVCHSCKTGSTSASKKNKLKFLKRRFKSEEEKGEKANYEEANLRKTCQVKVSSVEVAKSDTGPEKTRVQLLLLLFNSQKTQVSARPFLKQRVSMDNRLEKITELSSLFKSSFAD